ncbi:MAG: hypothetical protein JO154_22625 [Chitinophaga sp.]|uniref:RHS repeat domain-containing protein n=1 Tax=Chitinophaga sp. TaxID=1869181 RepID=UPI0025BE0FA1|nr:RHS repeat-associated core domain-containing protein [Chitinophaga sp.]MBV8255413.1 hypothetical protein [Chitinophaga sp.]
MLMPGRGGSLDTSGNWTVSRGGAIPVDLTVNSRSGNQPSEYLVSNSISFEDGFDTGVSDEFDARIVAAETGSGGSSGTGGSATNGGYRYGFNGKENDNEVKGEGNQQDYGMRIYDPRLGRFLSVDPLTKKYAFYTPYQFAGNKPIKYIDLDGAEEAPAEEEREALEYREPEIEEMHRGLVPETELEREAKARAFEELNRDPKGYMMRAFRALERMAKDEYDVRIESEIRAGKLDPRFAALRKAMYQGQAKQAALKKITDDLLSRAISIPQAQAKNDGNTSPKSRPQAQINSRHKLNSHQIATSGKVGTGNTTLAPSQTLSEDLASYNSGKFAVIEGGNLLINGNVYGVKNEGKTLYPISGNGFMEVTPGQIRAIKILKNTPAHAVDRALQGNKVTPAEREFAEDFIKKY